MAYDEPGIFYKMRNHGLAMRYEHTWSVREEMKCSDSRAELEKSSLECDVLSTPPLASNKNCMNQSMKIPAWKWNVMSFSLVPSPQIKPECRRTVQGEAYG